MLVEDAMLTPGWVVDLEAPSRARLSVPELGSVYPTARNRRPSSKRHALAAFAAVAVAAFATNWMFHHLSAARSSGITTVEAPSDELDDDVVAPAPAGAIAPASMNASVAPNLHREDAEGHSK
jgi:hypothetical protein